MPTFVYSCIIIYIDSSVNNSWYLWNVGKNRFFYQVHLFNRIFYSFVDISYFSYLFLYKNAWSCLKWVTKRYFSRILQTIDCILLVSFVVNHKVLTYSFNGFPQVHNPYRTKWVFFSRKEWCKKKIVANIFIKPIYYSKSYSNMYNTGNSIF